MIEALILFYAVGICYTIASILYDGLMAEWLDKPATNEAVAAGALLVLVFSPLVVTYAFGRALVIYVPRAVYNFGRASKYLGRGFRDLFAPPSKVPPARVVDPAKTKHAEDCSCEMCIYYRPRDNTKLDGTPQGSWGDW